MLTQYHNKEGESYASPVNFLIRLLKAEVAFLEPMPEATAI
jgi:hypothetical protein